MAKLAPFSFREEDFESLSTQSREQRRVVKNRLAVFGERVKNLLTEPEQNAIGDFHVGQLGEGADGAWIWMDTQHGRDLVNVTIELHPKELQVNMVGWNMDPSAKFEDWLLSDARLQTLQSLPEYDLVIYKRSAGNIAKRGTGAKPWWQRHIKMLSATRPAPQVDRGWVTSELKPFKDRSWEKPGFHIRRRWCRPTVIAAGERIDQKVAAEVQRLLPLLKEINSLKLPR